MDSLIIVPPDRGRSAYVFEEVRDGILECFLRNGSMQPSAEHLIEVLKKCGTCIERCPGISRCRHRRDSCAVTANSENLV